MTDMALDNSQDHSFLLQRVQPALTGLMDGSLSTIAPIFAVVLASHNPHYAFIAGLATSFGAAISMAFAEGLSDTGELTGRGNPAIRGAITGVGTFIGGILHTLPFLIPHYHVALVAAAVVVGFELIALAYVRVHFFKIGFLGSVLSVTLAGALIAVISALLGAAG
jgi:VIT1/CCC1 family predicted Fe2+/Mn2+ transporter